MSGVTRAVNVLWCDIRRHTWADLGDRLSHLGIVKRPLEIDESHCDLVLRLALEFSVEDLGGSPLDEQLELVGERPEALALGAGTLGRAFYPA